MSTLRKAPLFAVTSAILLALAGTAAALYPPDGLKSDGMGGYRNPDDGMCVIGVAADGTMLVDWSITNARDCVAWTRSEDGTVNLVGLDTSAKCTDADAAGSDGYKHAWSTSLCYDTVAQRGISRVDLDNTDAMCLAKGGTIVKTGKCVAYGWVYRNRKADGSLPVEGTGIGTTTGIDLSDGLGFCYAQMRMTATNADGGTYVDNTTCPSVHNDPVLSPLEWPACLSSANGCQTQASYDAGLGWSWSSGRCVYNYGVRGYTNGTITTVDGTQTPAGTLVDLSGITTQGECLAAGYAWDAWLPTGPGQAELEDNTGEYTGLPNTFLLYNPNALDPVDEGGGDFYTGTGSVCQKCHADQSRSYQERDKPGFYKTRHKAAGDAVGEPFQPFFTAANSDWGLDGVQCTMCHSTSRPSQDDLIQVNPAGTPNEGDPISASGHNNTLYGSNLVDICYTCHGVAAASPLDNPAEEIPVAAGELDLTPYGLEPITNEFLNSPHALYQGDSSKVAIGNKDNYGSTFQGYVCRTAATPFRSSSGQPGQNQTACEVTNPYTWYTTANNGNICYYSQSQCESLPTGEWVTTFSADVYPWAADVGGPGGVCAGVGIGSIIVTTYRTGHAEHIPFVDSAVNPACTNEPDGSSESGAGGFWVPDGALTDGTPADSSQGSCMTCHDVHWALADDDEHAEPLRRECSTCHMNDGPSVSNAPQIDIATINHLSTAGTPLVNMATNPDESCESCHMPHSAGPGSSPLHLWRINTDAAYSTFGASSVNLDVDGQAWIDVDLACGQCHGGGAAEGPGHEATPPALYRTKAQLALVAEGMHDAASVTYPVTFSAKVTGLDVVVDASVLCGGPCPTFTYDWNWGDGSAIGSGDPANHSYASGGKKTVSLTVRLDGKSVGSVTRSFWTNTFDLPPVASATCDWDADTWTLSVTDTSTDVDGILSVKVDWDDDSGYGVGNAGDTLEHAYRHAGTYNPTFTAIDTALKSAEIPLSCNPVSPAPFTISGTVYESDGSTPVEGANVVVKLGRTRMAKVKSAVDGTFSAGNLKPGNYKLKIRKRGFTFATPAATMTIGPDSVGNDIDALTP